MSEKWCAVYDSNTKELLSTGPMPDDGLAGLAEQCGFKEIAKPDFSCQAWDKDTLEMQTITVKQEEIEQVVALANLESLLQDAINMLISIRQEK